MASFIVWKCCANGRDAVYMGETMMIGITSYKTRLCQGFFQKLIQNWKEYQTIQFLIGFFLKRSLRTVIVAVLGSVTVSSWTQYAKFLVSLTSCGVMPSAPNTLWIDTTVTNCKSWTDFFYCLKLAKLCQILLSHLCKSRELHHCIYTCVNDSIF